MKLVCCFTSSTLLNGFCFSVYSITETIDETLHAIYFEELYYKTRRKSNQKLVRSTINCPTMLATSGGTTGDVVADLIASSSVPSIFRKPIWCNLIENRKSGKCNNGSDIETIHLTSLNWAKLSLWSDARKVTSKARASKSFT